MSDSWGLVKDLVLCDEHKGQKVYQIEKEVTYIVKTIVRLQKMMMTHLTNILSVMKQEIARDIMLRTIVLILYLAQKNIQIIKELN